MKVLISYSYKNKPFNKFNIVYEKLNKDEDKYSVSYSRIVNRFCGFCGRKSITEVCKHCSTISKCVTKKQLMESIHFATLNNHKLLIEFGDDKYEDLNIAMNYGFKLSDI